MCGIIGIVSSEPVSSRLLIGLKQLEYRGYDSAGIATIHQNTMDRRRSTGKLQNLINLVETHPIPGTIGIGHTRWATHGRAVTENAHPHSNEKVAVVHNGIIENFATLKNDLQKQGYDFHSETDTEVIVHLIDTYLKKGCAPLDAVHETLAHLRGAFALAIIFSDDPDTLIATRRGSPLALGIKQSETNTEIFVGSDALAFSSWTQTVCYLEDGDIAHITRGPNGATHIIYDKNKTIVTRPLQQSAFTGESASKNGYDHFMLKEIHEQPIILKNTLISLLHQNEQPPIDWKTLRKIRIIACGTSFYAGMVAKYWLEQWGGIETDVEIASEFRYRSPVLSAGELVICLSQSGETSDTLAALSLVQTHALAKSIQTLAIVNVPESSLARKADFVLQTLAGPEIGVAATKTLSAQLMVLACLCVTIGRARQTISDDTYTVLVDALETVPGLVSHILDASADYRLLANDLTAATTVLYLGRGLNFPVALEGALKLKEITYIHAEGYAAGELKHGPIALIDKTVPVIVIAPHDDWFEKTSSNIQEVLARDGQVICFTDSKGADHLRNQTKGKNNLKIMILPNLPTSFIGPLLYIIPVQLLAYYTASLKGTDADQPRNLAKSVTVE
ncbi:MAG: glutamine--fructose-6-phosphate transaminase (isomerizing) [Alphaproteobacteria bacterium]|nr:glutamine--fructose-6-phosphate transaminase (isomerizing) [Alphaproteobacteria bacterium]